ncbi:MAG: hypothetical protein V4724_23830 [Pseudomonadota bacterium]
MQTPAPLPGAYPPGSAANSVLALAAEGSSSGVSWSAVLAGAVAAAALSFILLILGVGLGLSTLSPWSYNDAAIGKSTIIWLAFMQLASAGLGGYLAGRLRVKWANVHGDEVYFRDTAHGLLAWALATVLTAGLMAGAVRAVLSGAIDAGAGVATVAAAGGAAAAPALAKAGASKSGDATPGAYFTDMLLRSDAATPETDNGAMRAEVGRILANTASGAMLPVEDRQYLATLISKRTGLAQSDAERRVDDVNARLAKARADAETAAKTAADKARKAAAYSALWMFVALLLGAFFASLCATFGGHQRDRIAPQIRR